MSASPAPRAVAARRALLLALLVLGAPAPARAFTRSSSNWNPAALPIAYRINTASAPPSIGAAGAQSAVEAGFASWAAPTCTRWRATNAGTTAVVRASSSDGQNTISWISGSWPAELGDPRSVIGVTTPVWRVGGFVLDADIQFNNVGFSWSLTGAAGTVDTQSIATHEQGHFLGLDHTPTTSAIMFASYPGGIKRALAMDDINGVCTIYPSGGAVPDAGAPTDPCAGFGSCAGCTPNAMCGWCGASNTCSTGTSSGPSAGSCGGGWIWDPRACGTSVPDAGSSSDPCSRFTSCGACTPINGCGWCGAAGRCQSGTTTGPSGGATCASGWAWLSTECAGSTPGTAAFGEPCTRPTDCASGGLCATTDGVRGFCTRTCTDDCTCPRGYRCASNSAGTLRACVPGANTCPDPGTPDSGTVTPTPDAGVTPRPDAGSTGMPDAGTTPPMSDAGSDAGVRRDGGAEIDTGGCGCRSTPARGAGRETARALLAAALVALGAALARSRRGARAARGPSQGTARDRSN